RKNELNPRFETLHSFLLEKEESHILSPMMKKAIKYPLKRWDSLKRFMDYSFATSSNNEALCAGLLHAQVFQKHSIKSFNELVV
ncbi:MAG: transposase, partial [Bacilli bacterium]